MPSFDVVSEADLQEVRNAVDQANREISTRFDFKGVDAAFELSGAEIHARAQETFHLRQMLEILRQKLTKRQVDIQCLEIKPAETNLNSARQKIIIRQGLDAEVARKMIKAIKTAKIKVQAQVQGEQLRVTGKKRDDLQEVITLLRQEDYDLPLQFTNFRE